MTWLRRHRWLAVVALAAALLVVVSACGGDSDDESSAGDEAGTGSPTTGTAEPGTNPFLADGEGPGCDGEAVVVGALRAESGYQAPFDTSVGGGADLAIEDYEAAGCPGSGRPIELVSADYRSDISLVPEATQQVLADGADIIMPGCDFDLGAPAARIANNMEMVAIGCAGGTLFGVEGIGPFVFNTWHGNPSEGVVMAEFAAKQGYEAPRLLVDTSVQYSKEGCDFAEQRLTDLGIPAVGKTTFLQGDQSFSSQVSEVRQDSEADSLLICSFPPGGATLIQQLRAAGVDLPIIGQGAGFDGDRWQPGKLSDFFDAAVVASLFGDDPEPFINELVERFTEETGEAPPVSNFVVGYVTVELIAAALTETEGDASGVDLRDAMNEFSDQPTVLGPVSYTPDCHVVFERELRVLETENGKPSFLETIEPEELPDAPC